MSSAFKCNTLGLRSLGILIASHGLRLNGRQGTGEDGSPLWLGPPDAGVSLGGHLFLGTEAALAAKRTRCPAAAHRPLDSCSLESRPQGDHQADAGEGDAPSGPYVEPGGLTQRWGRGSVPWPPPSLTHRTCGRSKLRGSGCV